MAGSFPSVGTGKVYERAKEPETIKRFRDDLIKVSEYDRMTDALRKTQEISEKLANQVSPILEQQEKWQKTIDSASVKLLEIPVSSTAMDSIRKVADNNTLKNS